MLQCVPRCVSTAFGMYFMGRPDTHYVHERLARLQHFEELQHHSPEPKIKTAADMRNLIAAELQHPELLLPTDHPSIDALRLIFRKEMSYYLFAGNGKPIVPLSALHNHQHAFMTRDPARALASHYQKDNQFTWHEAGYESQVRMYRWAQQETGEDPVVVDAGDFTANPDDTMSQFCSHLGLRHDSAYLEWEPPVDAKELKIWAHGKWHKEVEKSTGIHKSHEKKLDITALPQRVINMIERARDLYEEVLSSSNRIRPKTSAKAAPSESIV